MGAGEWGWRNVRRSGFRQAYRRMSFLTIETGCVEREELRIEN